jgi:lysophospholipase L1-like esterase
MRASGWWRIALGASAVLTASGVLLPSAPAHAATAGPGDPICVGGTPGALDHYRAAIGADASTPADVLFLGDSLTEGYYASSDATRWIELTRDALRTAHPTSAPGGVGFVPAFHSSPGLANRWTYGSTRRGVPAPTFTSPTEGLALRAANLTADGQYAELTFTGDRIWVAYTQGPTRGSLAISIDGGRAVTVNANAATPRSGRMWVSGPLTAGAHSVRVTPVVVKRQPTNVLLDGAMVFAGDGGATPDTGRGVRMWDHGRGGATASWFTSMPAGAHDAVDWIRPDLILIGLGANDVKAMTAEQYRAALTTIVDRYRSGYDGAPPTDASIALWVEPNRSDVAPATWRPFVDAMYAVARDRGLAVLDLDRRLGPVTAGPLWADVIHPTDAGERAIADAIVQGLDSGPPCQPISGRVADASNTGLSGICVYAARTGVDAVMAAALTGQDGSFTLPDLTPGTYELAFDDCSGLGRGTVWYRDASDRAGATSVSAGTTGLDVVMTPTSTSTNTSTSTSTPPSTTSSTAPSSTSSTSPASADTTLTGRVVDDAGRPVAGECVYVFDAGAPSTDRLVRSDADGRWSYTGLAAGAAYDLGFYDCVGRGFLPEWFRDRGARTALTTVTPGQGEVEAVLSLPAPASSLDQTALAGRVTDPASTPIEGVCVYAFDEGVSSTTRMVRTNGDGSWSFAGLTPGARYQLGFYDCSGQGFTAEWYADAPTQAQSTPVPAGTAGVAAVMERPAPPPP